MEGDEIINLKPKYVNWFLVSFDSKTCYANMQKSKIRLNYQFINSYMFMKILLYASHFMRL